MSFLVTFDLVKNEMKYFNNVEISCIYTKAWIFFISSDFYKRKFSIYCAILSSLKDHHGMNTLMLCRFNVLFWLIIKVHFEISVHVKTALKEENKHKITVLPKHGKIFLLKSVYFLYFFSQIDVIHSNGPLLQFRNTIGKQQPLWRLFLYRFNFDHNVGEISPLFQVHIFSFFSHWALAVSGCCLPVKCILKKWSMYLLTVRKITNKHGFISCYVGAKLSICWHKNKNREKTSKTFPTKYINLLQNPPLISRTEEYKVLLVTGNGYL